MIYVCVQRQYLTADCEWKYDIHTKENEKWNIS